MEQEHSKTTLGSDTFLLRNVNSRTHHYTHSVFSPLSHPPSLFPFPPHPPNWRSLLWYWSLSLNAYKEKKGIWKGKSIKEKPTDSSVDPQWWCCHLIRKPMVILERKSPVTHFMRCWSYITLHIIYTQGSGIGCYGTYKYPRKTRL